MSLDLLKHLSNKIKEEMQVISDDIAMGKAKDFGEYKHAVGILRGLMIANSILAATADKYEEIE